MIRKLLTSGIFLSVLVVASAFAAKPAHDSVPILQTCVLADGSVLLSWSSSAKPLVLERAVGGNVYYPLHTVRRRETCFMDSTVASNTLVCYRLRPPDARYLSEYGLPASVSLAFPVPRPPILRRVGLDSVEVSIGSPADSGDFVIAERRIHGIFAEVGRILPGQTRFVDGGLSFGAYHRYRLRYGTDRGAGAASAFDSVLLDLPLPRALETIPVTDHTVRLEWSVDSPFKCASEVVKWSPRGIERFHVPAGQTRWTDTNLGYDVSNVYRVRSVSGGDSSAFCSPVPYSFRLSPVTGLKADPIHDLYVHLTWEADLSPASHYTLERSTDSVVFTRIADLAPACTSFVDSSVASGAVYFYRITSLTASGTSLSSDPIVEDIPSVYGRMVLVPGDSLLPMFYMDAIEVTVDQYVAYCSATGRELPEDPFFSGISDYWGKPTNLPAVNVSWWDAIRFCNWRSEYVGLESAYDSTGNRIPGARGYHLPGRLQYRHAWSMAVDSDSHLWDEASAWGGPTGVPFARSTFASALFLKGNVWEWAEDVVENDARAVLGGSYCTPVSAAAGLPEFCYLPSHKSSTLGFRCVLEVRK
ncbi:MAG: SUMF1/EgtB/PvdO family nonheme iron enzyme [bacterium]|nr:SUMF1/EgtB/PvdO family nonheme iron enzyme [bacterium]